jgi:hypothetical protein
MTFCIDVKGRIQGGGKIQNTKTYYKNSLQQCCGSEAESGSAVI